METTIDITPVNNGIAVDDAATGTGYIMYSEENVFDRFSEHPPLAGNADHLIAVRVIDGEWFYNDNSTQWYKFEPADSDRLLATVDFDSDTSSTITIQGVGLGSNMTTYAYDRLNHITWITAPNRDDVRTDRVTHNWAGQVSEVSVAEVQNTSYVYDDLLRQRTYTDPMGKSETINYDGYGRVAEIVQRDGRRISYSYDAKNRVEFEYWHTGPSTVATLSFAYFPAGNSKQEIYSGNLANPVLGYSSRQVYDYDVLGRLDDVFSYATGRSAIVSDYGHDANGNQEWLSSTINRSLKYSLSTAYDGLNRPSHITKTANLVTGVSVQNAQFSYLADGRIDTVTRFSGLALNDNSIVAEFDYLPECRSVKP